MSRISPPRLQYAETIVQLAQGKGWGSHTVDAETRICAELARATGVAQPLALDVGANVGLWSTGLLRFSPNARIFAFEPSAKAFEALRNRFDGDARVTPVNLAVGARSESGVLHFDEPGSGLGSLTRRNLDGA